MSDVIDRLRASKVESEDLDYEHGRTLGEEWAKKSAEYSELTRVRELYNSCSRMSDWELWFESNSNDAYSAADRLYFVMCPENEGSRGDAGEYWEVNGWDETTIVDDDGKFVRGFAEGALDVLAQVEDRL